MILGVPNNSVVLVEYNSEWPIEFEKEKKRIVQNLQDVNIVIAVLNKLGYQSRGYRSEGLGTILD